MIKNRLKATVSVGLVWLTSACSPVTVLNAMIPEQGYHRVADIAYGEAPRQKLDIYLAKGVTNLSERSTILFFYGGSWESGQKEEYKFVAEALTSVGFDVVIPDYRVYPEVLFPTFVDDAAKAASWSEQHLADYGLNSERIFVAGHSAGAHIAALLTLDKHYLQQYALTPDIFKGMIGLAGPYDFLPLKSDTLKTIFGPESSRWRSQPINFVDGDNPPMLLLVGNNDRTVLPRNSRHLADKVQENDGKVNLVEFDDYGHVAMVAKLAKPLRGEGRLLKTIRDFVLAH